MEHEENQEKKVNGTSHSVSTILKAVFAIVGAIVLLFTSYHGVISYLDSRIDAKINNADFLKKLARSVRPSLVFDEKGSIVADMGAVSFVNNISVSKGTGDSFNIVVTPIEYLAAEPLIEALDDSYTARAERGKKFEWFFRLYHSEASMWERSPRRDRQRFRLEIIR